MMQEDNNTERSWRWRWGRWLLFLCLGVLVLSLLIIVVVQQGREPVIIKETVGDPQIITTQDYPFDTNDGLDTIIIDIQTVNDALLNIEPH